MEPTFPASSELAEEKEKGVVAYAEPESEPEATAAATAAPTVTATTTKKAETGASSVAKTQRAKDATRRLVDLSRRGLSSSKEPGSVDNNKTLKTSKKLPVKPNLEEPVDFSDLVVVFPQDQSLVPRVDIIAVHDVDETLQKAWVYRKRTTKRRQNVNDFRVPAVYASGGINSHDGEAGAVRGTGGGSPAAAVSGNQRRPLRQTASFSSSTGRKKNVEDSIQRWLAVSARSDEEDISRETPAEMSIPEQHGQIETPVLPSPSPSALTPLPIQLNVYGGDSGMLPPVPEDDDDNVDFFQISDDIFASGAAPTPAPASGVVVPAATVVPVMRRRPTFSKERRKSSSGRVPTISEEQHNPASINEVISERQSSDQGFWFGVDRRVNWLTDLEMLPGEVPGGVRVMGYTYRSGTDKVPSAWQYLTERAEDLVKRIVQKRTSDAVDYTGIPIVFIGAGFGALIIQRAVNLLATSRVEETPSTGLHMVAGFVFLDAPSPGGDREQFPRSRSQEAKKAWTQDWLGKQRGGGGGGVTKIDTSSLWNLFRPFAAVMHGIPILWHYSPMVPLPGKPAITPKSPDVLFLPKQSLTSHRLSRFEGPNDPDYRSIRDYLKRCLIVKYSTTTSEKLAAYLQDFLKDTLAVDLRDQHGQTALHLAVRAGNPGAVKRLIHQGKASVARRDNEGRSPLNIAVQEAVHKVHVSNAAAADDNDPDDVDGHAQKAQYTQIINLLIKNGARVDDRDNDGKTPWAYAEGEEYAWIRRLKEKHLVIGSSSSFFLTAGMLDMVIAPPKEGPQKLACLAYDVILAEVFLQKKRERFSEIFNIDLASVYDIIYRGTGTPVDMGTGPGKGKGKGTGGNTARSTTMSVSTSAVAQTLEASRPEQMTADKVRCRWVHLPANNEQWVHDLLITLGIIQDGGGGSSMSMSMGGQRHEGSKLIDRYMMPQARRYKHFHLHGIGAGTGTGTAAKKKALPPEPRPKPDRFGSAESAATVVLGSDEIPPTVEEVRAKQVKAGKVPVADMSRAESDAIVIFMPILGFEKHRHRKYLTQAFHEADRAIKLARHRDESPNPKSTANDTRKMQDSSDSEESPSEQETSRLYPTIRVTRAREQVKTAREAHLLTGYLDSSSHTTKPVHCRRTLDQFSYYMLNSTEARDKSQVTYRWAKNPTVCSEAKNRPIIMVEQLWLWALHDGTIITCSPSTWTGQEDYNLSNVIIRELRYNKDRPIIKSTEDLLHLILKTSLDFFKRKGPANCQFHECFQSSINKVSEQQGHLFDNFRRTTKRLHVGRLDRLARKKEIEFLFSLDEETELLVEIMDIQDELTIVKTILGQQQVVLEGLARLYPKKVDEEEDEGGGVTGNVGTGLGKNEMQVLQGLVQLLREQSTLPGETKSVPVVERLPVGASGLHGQGPKKRKEKDETKSSGVAAKPAPAKTNILQNRDLLYETIGIVESNIRVVTDMLAYAEKVESSLENLLDLKQKHANGWEARFAREGSEEAQRQGNIILVFTLVTVIFLPLSFLTSFFAVGIDTFPHDEESGELDWPMYKVAGLLFGISSAISFPLILLALYVNKLITHIKRSYKQIFKALREPDTLLLDPVPEDNTSTAHDSDEERTHLNPLNHHQIAKSLRYGGPGDADKNTDSDSDSADATRHGNRYAPFLGHHLHTKIPMVRNLWRYQKYRQPHARRKDNRWKDTYVTDYPLRYYSGKVKLAGLLAVVAVLAWFKKGSAAGPGKHQRARARAQVRARAQTKRRRRQREKGVESSDSSSDSSSSEERGDDAQNAPKAERREKSLSSGYWVNRPGRDRDGDGDWSNQTRSRGSLRFSEESERGRQGGEAKKTRLAWLRLRRKRGGKEALDEETGRAPLDI